MWSGTKRQLLPCHINVFHLMFMSMCHDVIEAWIERDNVCTQQRLPCHELGDTVGRILPPLALLLFSLEVSTKPKGSKGRRGPRLLLPPSPPAATLGKAARRSDGRRGNRKGRERPRCVGVRHAIQGESEEGEKGGENATLPNFQTC